MQARKQQLELYMEQQTPFLNRKRRTSRLYIVTLLFNLYAEYIMRNVGLNEAQAGIKMAEEITITSDMQMTPPLWQKT